jgi:hypothetical protein
LGQCLFWIDFLNNHTYTNSHDIEPKGGSMTLVHHHSVLFRNKALARLEGLVAAIRADLKSFRRTPIADMVLVAIDDCHNFQIDPLNEFGITMEELLAAARLSLTRELARLLDDFQELSNHKQIIRRPVYQEQVDGIFGIVNRLKISLTEATTLEVAQELGFVQNIAA